MQPSRASLDRARELHQTALVFDAHVDTLSEMLDGNYDLDSAPDSAHLSWPKIQHGGLKSQLFACFVHPVDHADGYAARVHRLIDRFEEEIARVPGRMVHCRSGAEIERAYALDNFAAMLSIEGGHAIEDSLDTLRAFYNRGVRAMTLTWNNTNSWADACGPMDPSITQHGGLTDFGREVVASMEELGMAVDISHVAPSTFNDVLESCTKAPFASHSSLKALNDHRRNLSDDQLRALAGTGGVLGVCFCSGFLMDESAAWAKAKQSSDYATVSKKTDSVDFAGISNDEYAIYEKFVPRATLDWAVDHVERALQVMGTKNVALGTDFDGARRFPVGLEHIGLLPALTAGLLDRGWTETELKGVLGRNLLDYFKRVID